MHTCWFATYIPVGMLHTYLLVCYIHTCWYATYVPVGLLHTYLSVCYIHTCRFATWVLVSVIAVFWATIPNPTRPRVADSGTPYRYIG